jgi:hypothetical protein
VYNELDLYFAFWSIIDQRIKEGWAEKRCLEQVGTQW